MKTLLIIFCICIVMSCEDSQRTDYTWENEIYDCVKNKFEENEKDADEIIGNIEKHLIEKTYLDNNSSEAYYKLVQELLKKEDYKVPISENVKEQIIQIIRQSVICSSLQDTSFYRPSRAYEIDAKVQEGFVEAVTKDEIDHSLIAKSMLQYFEVSDFEIKLFKIQFFQFLYFQEKIARQDRGVMNKLPPWGKDDSNYSKPKEHNILSILVNKKNQLIVRDSLMKIKDLRVLVKNFISNPDQDPQYAERPDKAIISLRNERGTNYETYLKVLNSIKAAYTEIRNEEAIKLYGKPFDELEREQQKEIRNIIPRIISEAEPTAFGEEG